MTEEKQKYIDAYNMWKTLSPNKERNWKVGRQFGVSVKTVERWCQKFKWHDKMNKENMKISGFDEDVLNLSYHEQNEVLLRDLQKAIQAVMSRTVSGSQASAGQQLKPLLELRDNLYKVMNSSETEQAIYEYAKKPLSEIKAELASVEKSIKELKKMAKKKK